MIWFKFYTAWGEGVQELSDTEAGRFLKAVCACAESREIPTLSGAEKVLFAIASKQIKQDADRNAEISRTRAEVGRIGGLTSKQLQAKGSNCKQKEAKQANASNCSIKELRIKNTEKEVNLCAEARGKADPDSSDFWKFAKENSELAEEFHKLTGLTPVKSQFGRWINDLRDLAEAEITVDRMRKTVIYMQSKELPISAPGSILKTAQWLKARGSVPVQRQSDADRWDVAAAEVNAEISDAYGYLPEYIEVE